MDTRPTGEIGKLHRDLDELQSSLNKRARKAYRKDTPGLFSLEEYEALHAQGKPPS